MRVERLTFDCLPVVHSDCNQPTFASVKLFKNEMADLYDPAVFRVDISPGKMCASCAFLCYCVEHVPTARLA